MSTQYTRPFVSFGMVAGIFWGLGFPSLAWVQQPQSVEQLVHPLVSAQVLLVESLALTEQGLQDPSTITKTVADKLRQAGFSIASSPDQPHDAVVRVKCEEQKIWTGPSNSRNTSPVLTSRLWKGPACHVTYRYKGHSSNWHWEVRTPFEDTRAASEAAGVSIPGTFALNALNAQLQKDDFPLFLLAEWEQADRLLMLFHSTNTIDQQMTILKLMGTLSSDKPIQTLKEALTKPALAPTALLALGQKGEMAIPILVSYLDTTTNSKHRLTAIQALGVIATQSSAPVLFTQFMNHLGSENLKIQTEAVKGLGNFGDRRGIQPLEKLNLQVWAEFSNNPDMNALREMLSWSIKQLKPNAHTGE